MQIIFPLFFGTVQTTKEGIGGSQRATPATGGLSLRHSGENISQGILVRMILKAFW